MIVGGYHFMNTNIPPPFATNCIPVMPQVSIFTLFLNIFFIFIITILGYAKYLTH